MQYSIVRVCADILDNVESRYVPICLHRGLPLSGKLKLNDISAYWH